jgi:hypothetical protein
MWYGTHSGFCCGVLQTQQNLTIERARTLKLPTASSKNFIFKTTYSGSKTVIGILKKKLSGYPNSGLAWNDQWIWFTVQQGLSRRLNYNSTQTPTWFNRAQELKRLTTLYSTGPASNGFNYSSERYDNCEVVLTNSQRRYFHQGMLAQGFRVALDSVNPNSGNRCFVYLKGEFSTWKP